MNTELRHPFATSFVELAQLAAADAGRYAELIFEELDSAGAIPWEAIPSFDADSMAEKAGAAEVVPAAGAGSINLFLRLNGVVIAGEPLVSSAGRQDSIECLSYQQAVVTSREAGSWMARGRRQYAPLVVAKRIDKSSPLLAKGLTENQLAEGTVKFYRPKPVGDGTVEHYYTVAFQNGRISALKQSTTDGLIEEVAFVFQTISWTYVNGGISHQDSWNSST